MNPFAFSGLLILISSIILSLFVLKKSGNNKTNKLWVIFMLVVALWGFGSLLVGLEKNIIKAIFLWKIAFASVIFIPSVFLHFTCVFLKQEKKLLIKTYYIISCTYLITLLCNNLLTDYKIIFNSVIYTTKPNLVYKSFFVFWCSIMFYSYTLVYKSLTSPDPIKNNQIKYFFLTTTTGYIGGISNFLPAFGFNFYPYGNFLVAIFPAATTYVILKYKLMDINIVIKKSITYTFLIAFIALIYFISIYFTEHALRTSFKYHSAFFSIFFASVIALLFIPIKNFFEKNIFRKSLGLIAEEHELMQKEVIQTEKLKAVATLASGLAHEIRNPLTSLKTFSEYLPAKKDDPAFIAKYQQIVPQEIERINNLVNDLLAFAKPCPPLFQDTNPNEIIQNLLSMLESKIKHSNIKVTTKLDANIQIQADPNQLKQALLNLILNAIDAMPNGGSLTISTQLSFPNVRQPSVGEISTIGRNSIGNLEHKCTRSPINTFGPACRTGRDDKKHYIITISDTGCGIDPKTLPHIFEPFYTKKEKGTGLGLSITKGIIENHGGIIEVNSEVNKGTKFNIYFGQIRI